MKMTKNKNIIVSILFVVLVIIGTVSITVFSRDVHESYALDLRITNAQIANGSDVVSIRATAGAAPIVGYYVGTSDNINSATFYPARNQNTYSVSLINGTYHFWVKDGAGKVAKYAQTITISKSCSSDFVSNAKGDGTSKHCYYTSDGKYLEETKSEQLITCANGYQRDQSKTTVIENSCASLDATSIRNMGVSKKVCYQIWSYSCVPTGGGNAGDALSVLNATTSNDWTNGNKEIVVTAKKGSANIAGYYISTNSNRPDGGANWNASNSTTWTTSQGAGTYYIWVKDESGHISSNYKSVTVSKIETAAPHIDSVIPSSINKNLTINASDEGGSGIAGYYISSENSAPNLSSDWNNSNANSYTIEKEPGTYYIWVKDVAGNISAGKTATIATANTTSNNSLASLSIKDMELTPEFNPDTTEYTATASVSKAVIDATLQDSNASFVKNFGPRTVNLKSGVNNVLIKVKNAKDEIKEYKIKITYNGRASNVASARLKSLTLNSGNLTFDPDITEYRMYVPRSLEKLEVNAVAEDNNAEVKVENPETLEIGDNKVTITVTATDGTSTVYTLNIIKKETDQISTNNYLKSLTITGYDIEFARDVQEYKISLGNRTYLNVNAVAEDSNAEVTIDNTKYLTKDSVVHVMVRAEDGSARIYTILLNKSKITVWQIILIIIGIIFLLLVIAYVVLKLMGYSIYINFGVIKDFFINLFRRNKDDD